LFNYSSSIIAYSNGTNTFEVSKMPVVAQLSAVNSVVVADVNNDSKPDIILGGNLADCLPQFGRCDANLGTVLINNGNKLFSEMPASQTGIQHTGTVRDIKLITTKNETGILFLRNNEFPLYYVKTKN
jgi:enediyne biosynthesis protein E4